MNDNAIIVPLLNLLILSGIEIIENKDIYELFLGGHSSGITPAKMTELYFLG